jgi:hypothetical protein
MAASRNVIMGLFGRSKQNDAVVDQMRLLLDNFQFADLKAFCVDIIGENPAMDQEHLSRIEALDFVWDKYHKGKVKFSQLKEFALKHNLVTENFFE